MSSSRSSATSLSDASSDARPLRVLSVRNLRLRFKGSFTCLLYFTCFTTCYVAVTRLLRRTPFARLVCAKFRKVKQASKFRTVLLFLSVRRLLLRTGVRKRWRLTDASVRRLRRRTPFARLVGEKFTCLLYFATVRAQVLVFKGSGSIEGLRFKGSFTCLLCFTCFATCCTCFEKT